MWLGYKKLTQIVIGCPKKIALCERNHQGAKYAFHQKHNIENITTANVIKRRTNISGLRLFSFSTQL